MVFTPSKAEAVWFLSLTMLAVLIYELVVNQKAQGTPVSFHVRMKPIEDPPTTHRRSANGQRDVGTLAKRSNQRRRAISCLHEGCRLYTTHHGIRMYAISAVANRGY